MFGSAKRKQERELEEFRQRRFMNPSEEVLEDGGRLFMHFREYDDNLSLYLSPGYLDSDVREGLYETLRAAIDPGDRDTLRDALLALMSQYQPIGDGDAHRAEQTRLHALIRMLGFAHDKRYGVDHNTLWTQVD